MSMISIESYCSTAPQGKYEVCVDYTYLYAVAYLAVHVVQGFMTSVLALIFCKAIDRANLNRREGIFTKWS